jgi:hypothetical protein
VVVNRRVAKPAMHMEVVQMRGDNRRDRDERSTTVFQHQQLTPRAAARRDDVDFITAAGTAFERWRFWCPYGRWTCADGRQILFNRNYCAVYERRPGGLGRVADHAEWIEWVEQEFFFNDSNSPVSWWSVPSWQWQPVLARINRSLVGWALSPLRKRPPKRASSPRRRQRWLEREQARRARPPTPRAIVRKHNINGKLRRYLLDVKPPVELLDADDGWRRLDAVHWWQARCLLERGVPRDEAFILLKHTAWNRHRGEWRGDDKVRALISKVWSKPFVPWSEQQRARLSAHPTERGKRR